MKSPVFNLSDGKKFTLLTYAIICDCCKKILKSKELSKTKAMVDLEDQHVEHVRNCESYQWFMKNEFALKLHTKKEVLKLLKK